MNRYMNRLGLPSSAAALLLVGLLGACGSDSAEDDSAAGSSTAAPSSTTVSSSASPTPMPTPSASSTAAPTSTATPAPEPVAEFDVSMMRWMDVNKVNKGGQANVHVVAGALDTDALLEIANDCVEHYLNEQKAAFCHVWATDANYTARDPHGLGDTLCWTHYVGVPLVGGDPIVTTFEPYMLEIDGCPDIPA